MRTSHNFVDLTGSRFGRLTVLARSATKNGGNVKWDCICDCGNTCSPTSGALNSGHSKSCGCFSADKARKHGLNRSSEYRIWQQLKERCYNPNKQGYSRYGARGIYVCDRWLGDSGFMNFINDMGRRPPNRTLDRIDNNGPYSPDNCRWADNKTQYRNRRQTVWLTINGETLCKKDWCRRYNMDEATVSARIARGWTVERAVTTPPKLQVGKNDLRLKRLQYQQQANTLVYNTHLQTGEPNP